ncbi:NAD(P)-binding protein [Laetiporus sulphureus 93-53]|uniref:NAD(P)-binding protein n=1 Tax=Laetiporus sulphureus 93-53 TaxID=1314785 RepID=A0A165GDX2_9APHY|nr:NAD(P)-binding protein [Laetiporus sulphureus 93-53]KZT10212.1 NAD(P)-binding protein [Laetiporus sulphureus 93-53]
MAQISPAGRVALVTGASQGIGRSIALRLADDGLDVAVNDIESKRPQLESLVSDIEAKGRRAIAVPADVSQEDAVRSMISRTVTGLGGLDVMVANAAVALTKPMIETSTDEWDRIISNNLRSVFLSYKYAAIQMIDQGRGGRIIGASSIAGIRGSQALSAYSASKFAFLHYGWPSEAQELAPYRITVNAYAPGSILTPMTCSEEDTLQGKAPNATFKQAVGMSLEAPDGPPDVVASTVSYLAKSESYFVTGQTISMNGGVLLT